MNNGGTRKRGEGAGGQAVDSNIYEVGREKISSKTLRQNAAMINTNGSGFSSVEKFHPSKSRLKPHQTRSLKSSDKTLRKNGAMTKANGNQKSLVGPEVVAKILGVSRNTVLNWARDEKIPSVRIEKTYRFSLKIISEAINHPLEIA